MIFRGAVKTVQCSAKENGQVSPNSPRRKRIKNTVASRLRVKSGYSPRIVPEGEKHEEEGVVRRTEILLPPQQAGTEEGHGLAAAARGDSGRERESARVCVFIVSACVFVCVCVELLWLEFECFIDPFGKGRFLGFARHRNCSVEWAGTSTRRRSSRRAKQIS